MSAEIGRSALRTKAAVGHLFVFFLTAIFTFVLPACSGGGSNGGGDDGGSGPTVPATPSGLSAISQDGAVGLDWDVVSGADTYRVYRLTSTGVGTSGSPLDSGMPP